MTKILLVEDDKSLREIYGVRLLAEGYDIVSAGDGEEALAMAIKERPQLIVSDVMMPKISGFDMLDILRSTTETKDIKVIMMTALSSEDQRERGESLGADRYLVKSQVGIEDVVRTVHEVLGDTPMASAAGGNVFMQPPAPRSAAPTPQPAPGPQTPAPAVTAPQAPHAPAQQPTPAPHSPVSPSPQPQAAAPTAPAPQAVTPATHSASTPTPQPVQSRPTPPQFPQPNSAPPAPQASNLPQPTAPFSTNRPANLGDRIIHPIDQPGAKRDFSNLMAQELNSTATSPQPQPPASAPQQTASPTPQPSASAPQPMPSSQPATPSQPTSPAPQPSPAVPNLSFEEAPFPPRPPQPPTQPSA